MEQKERLSELRSNIDEVHLIILSEMSLYSSIFNWSTDVYD